MSGRVDTNIPFFHTEGTGADQECILYSLSEFLFSVAGWPDKDPE